MKMKLYLIHISSYGLKDSERTFETAAVDNKLMARDHKMTKTGGGSTAHQPDDMSDSLGRSGQLCCTQSGRSAKDAQ